MDALHASQAAIRILFDKNPSQYSYTINILYVRQTAIPILLDKIQAGIHNLIDLALSPVPDPYNLFLSKIHVLVLNLCNCVETLPTDLSTTQLVS